MHPFVIYVAWHPLFEEGKQYAERIYQTFNRNFADPFSRSIGVPVFYRSISNSGSEEEVPAAIDPNGAEHTAIVLLVDDCMVIHRQQWAGYLQQLIALDKGNQQVRIYPVAISKTAFSVSDVVNDKNFVRVFEKETTEQKARFLNVTLAHEFCRLILGFQRATDAKQDSLPRLKLFLSHSKADGVEITKLLKYWIQEFTGLETFFDATDISPGELFAEAIDKGVGNSSLLVVQTDIFSSREWCRAEVLEAKRHNRPVVVVNALDKGESRSFPYMSNVPVIRWKNENAADFSSLIERIILTVLLETLRHAYQGKRIDYQFKTFLKPGTDYKLLKHAPELLDLVNTEDGSINLKQHYIYPDPPLGNGELQILRRCMPGAQFSTPIQLIRDEAKRNETAGKFTIGISISESEKMEARGLSTDHLKDVMVEAARYLLASGYSLAYGGDIHYTAGFNFAMLLKEMVMTYRADYKGENAMVTNYVAFPIFKAISTVLEAELIDVVRFMRIPPPKELSVNENDDWQRILKAETVEDQYLFARCLTEMRIAMNKAIDARIILGGKQMGYKGRYPGLVEEALIAMTSDKPVFIIGAFGGCAASIIQALLGETPETLTTGYQYKAAPYKTLANYYKQQDEEAANEINYEKLVGFFNSAGIKGLNNGLTDEENKILFTSVDAGTVISLLLKGLQTCANK